MSRARGWESRLAAVLREAAGKPYHARHWNCAVFVHTCAQVVRAQALAFAWKGSLEASVDAVLGRVPVRFAQRGDVVLACVPEPSLGVCLGATSAFVTARGMITQPTTRATTAWGV